MSGARRSRRAEPSSRGDALLETGRARLVRSEFQPTLPALLRGRGRWVWAVALGVVVAIVGMLAVGRAGAEGTPSVLVHREPDFTMLIREGALRRAEPEGDEHVRLEGRGRFTSVTVTVAPLPRSRAGSEPTLGELPIETERLVDGLRRRHEGFTVLEEGRARVNDAPGYQVRHRSGSAAAPRFGHDVLLVPEPPATGAGLLVSLVQRNERDALGPDDRRVAYEAKRAFRSVRFGTERP